mgnify:CR=1 FL=1
MGKRLREKSLEDYGISKNRYKELQAFCLQYEEKKNKISRIKAKSSMDGQPRGNYAGKPTEEMAIRNVGYLKDCEMIEKAAIAASKDVYPYILKSVTNDLSYTFLEYDQELGRIPVGKTEFYAIRRLFYYYLDRMQLGTN